MYRRYCRKVLISKDILFFAVCSISEIERSLWFNTFASKTFGIQTDLIGMSILWEFYIIIWIGYKGVTTYEHIVELRSQAENEAMRKASNLSIQEEEEQKSVQKQSGLVQANWNSQKSTPKSTEGKFSMKFFAQSRRFADVRKYKKKLWSLS